MFLSEIKEKLAYLCPRKFDFKFVSTLYEAQNSHYQETFLDASSHLYMRVSGVSTFDLIKYPDAPPPVAKNYPDFFLSI